MNINQCPGCGGQEFEPLGDAKEVEVVLSGQEFIQPPYSVLSCYNCGLLFKSDICDGPTLGRYYALVDFRKWEIPGLFPTEQTALQRLEALPNGARILDYGCSSGRLLQHLLNKHECLGYEINASAAAIAAGKGIRMLSDLSSCELGSLDAVVLMDVFEHLAHPVDELRPLVNLLKPGRGLLLLGTGNGDASVFREDPARFWYMRTPEHLIMLTQRFSAYLGEQLGMCLQEWNIACHYDISLFDRLRDESRRFAFRAFHNPQVPPFYRFIAGLLPYLRRARHWTDPPMYVAGKDHVIAVMVRRAVA